jgi:hypothetical protein
MTDHDFRGLKNILKDIGYDEKIPNIEFEINENYKKKSC